MHIEVIANHRSRVERFREGDIDFADFDRYPAGGDHRRCAGDRGADGIQGEDFNGVEYGHNIALAVYSACNPHRSATRGHDGINGELTAPGRPSELQLLEGKALIADDGFDRRSGAAVDARVLVEETDSQSHGLADAQFGAAKGEGGYLGSDGINDKALCFAPRRAGKSIVDGLHRPEIGTTSETL